MLYTHVNQLLDIGHPQEWDVTYLRQLSSAQGNSISQRGGGVGEERDDS